MTLLQAAVLGIVQGLTEFLPVSSSGHLILVPALFGWEPHPVAFDAAIHLGTFFAVVFALRDDVKRILRGLFVPGDAWGGLGWMVVVATLPVLLSGFLIGEVWKPDLRDPRLIVGTLAFWGVALYLVDRFAPSSEGKAEKAGWSRSLLMGLAQVLALLPGTSRSGVTITAGRALGLTREAAARFSFLLSIPAVAAASALSLVQVGTGAAEVPALPLAMGIIASAVSGALAIRWLIRLMRTATYAPFALYRLALAALAAIVLL
ncbi:undecaprenyl-diphosphate phosphatase [Patescibacteria group bacterium]|nr:MAG: undecaprenyl-diphosphate phosphatase [Patescibacteria group bacterium]